MAVVMTGGKKRITVIRSSGSKNASSASEERDDIKRRVANIDGVKFVVIDPSGNRQTGAIIEELGETKKQSRALKPVEKRVRKALRAQLRSLNVYLSLHDRSNRKRKNGWLRDLASNLNKARRKSAWE